MHDDSKSEISATLTGKTSEWHQITQKVLTKRPSIEGYVQLQRKSQWVRRYAIVNGPSGVFSYKESEQDGQVRFTVDLRIAKIKKGMRVTSVNGEVPIPGCGESAINLVTTKDRPLTIGACNASHSTAMSFFATGSIALRSYLVRVVQYAG